MTDHPSPDMKPPLKIRVVREACCAQDDQLGPLEMHVELPAAASLQDLVDAVEQSRFLQYSGTHVSMQGESGGQLLVTVFSAYYRPGQPAQFAVSPRRWVSGLIEGGLLAFRFVF